MVSLANAELGELKVRERARSPPTRILYYPLHAGLWVRNHELLPLIGRSLVDLAKSKMRSV
jgi:hypothetical protein